MARSTTMERMKGPEIKGASGEREREKERDRALIS